jgi:hypothetical protein
MLYQDASLLRWKKHKDMRGAKVEPHLIGGHWADCALLEKSQPGGHP